MQGLTGRRIEIKIVEVACGLEIDAQLISEDIAEQLQENARASAAR